MRMLTSTFEKGSSRKSIRAVLSMTRASSVRSRPPLVGLRQSGEDPEAGRLARAVRPEQAEHLALLDLEGDLVEGADPRILLHEAGGLYKHPGPSRTARRNNPSVPQVGCEASNAPS